MRLISLLLGSCCVIVSGFAQSVRDLHSHGDTGVAHEMPRDMPIQASSADTISGEYLIREDIHLQHLNAPYIPLRDSLYSKIFSRSVNSYRLDNDVLTPLSSDEAIGAFEIQQGYDGNQMPVFWPSSAISIFSIVRKVTLHANEDTCQEKKLGISLILGGEHSLDGMDTYMVTFAYEDVKDEIVAEWVHPLNDQIRMPAWEAIDRKFLTVQSVSASNSEGDLLYLPDVHQSTLNAYQSDILFPCLRKYLSYGIPKTKTMK
jgi:hypothetical protein